MISNTTFYVSMAAALILILQGIVSIIQAVRQSTRIDKIETNAEQSLVNIHKIIHENQNVKINIEEIKSKVSELYVLHNVRDDVGVPVWYNNSNFIKELIHAVAKLNDSIINQNSLLNRQIAIFEAQSKK